MWAHRAALLCQTITNDQPRYVLPCNLENIYPYSFSAKDHDHNTHTFSEKSSGVK